MLWSTLPPLKETTPAPSIILPSAFPPFAPTLVPADSPIIILLSISALPLLERPIITLLFHVVTELPAPAPTKVLAVPEVTSCPATFPINVLFAAPPPELSTFSPASFPI